MGTWSVLVPVLAFIGSVAGLYVLPPRLSRPCPPSRSSFTTTWPSLSRIASTGCLARGMYGVTSGGPHDPVAPKAS